MRNVLILTRLPDFFTFIIFTFSSIPFYSNASNSNTSLNLDGVAQDAVLRLVSRILSDNRIFSFSVRVLSKDTDRVHSWHSIVGQTYPTIFGKVNSFETRGPVFSIFLLNMDTKLEWKYPTSNLENFTLQSIATFCHRQRDHFIFIGEKQTISSLWKIPKINRLRFRWGYTTDTNEFMSRVEGLPLEPLFSKSSERFSVTRNDFGNNVHGRHIKIAGYAHVPPYHFIRENDANGKPIYDGSHVRLFHEASLIFNFTYELFSDEEAGSYGEILPNGSWTGMIGAVTSETYDLVLYLGPSLIWQPLFDFSGSLSGAAVRFMTPRPTSEIRWQAFLHPFRLTLWVALMALFVFVLISILIVMYVATTMLPKKVTRFPPVIATTMMTFAIAMEQTAHIPRGVRMICGAWLVFSIIIGTAYKSQVMSSLTLPFSEKPPSTYQELAQHKDYKSILNNIGGLEVAYFQSNDSQLISTIAKTMKYEPVPINCIAKAVLNPKTVCAGWFPFLEYTMAEWASPDAKISSSYISVDPAIQTIVSVAFQKYSPYSQGFAPIINGFWESGIYRVWEGDVLRIHKNKGVSNYRKNPETPLNKRLMTIIEDISGGNEEKPLKLSNLKMMFAILVSGVCIAVSIFLCESTIHLYRLLRKSKLKVTVITVHSAITIG